MSGEKTLEARRAEVTAAELLEDVRRAAPRTGSRIPWIAIVLGALVVSGLVRGWMRNTNPPPPRPPITLPQNLAPPSSTDRVEEMLRRMREDANRPNPPDSNPFLPERATTPLDAFSGLPAEDAERLRRLLYPELPQPRRADPNEPNPWRISPTRPNPTRPNPPAYPQRPGGVLPPIQGPQFPNRPTP